MLALVGSVMSRSPSGKVLLRGGDEVPGKHRVAACRRSQCLILDRQHGHDLAEHRSNEGVAGDVDALVPGHGSTGGADQVRTRIDQGRAYMYALRDAHVPSDRRVGPSATYVRQGLAAWRAHTATPAPRPEERARRDARLAIRLRNEQSPFGMST
jgi:hypothetical protein